jgi:hypothetical protein
MHADFRPRINDISSRPDPSGLPSQRDTPSPVEVGTSLLEEEAEQDSRQAAQLIHKGQRQGVLVHSPSKLAIVKYVLPHVHGSWRIHWRHRRDLLQPG